MKRKNRPRLIDDFVARPSSGSVSGHPEASRFPSVGMTLNSYRTKNETVGRPRLVASQVAVSGATRASIPSALPLPARPKERGQKGRTGRWQRLRAKLTWRRALTALGVLVLLFVCWFGFKFFYNLSKTFGGNVFGIFDSTRLKGEDVGRVNILLAGNSADDPGHNGANLTDSIMILSVDTKHNTAFMLSVPRDLWVNIPGNGYQKINAAYEDGQVDHFSYPGYPSGGMGQLEQIITQNFGLTLNYYALIDYAALRDAVNAVGGIDVTINSSDPRGLYDPDIDWSTGGVLVNLKNGKNHLSGEQALDLARARGDAYGSYGFPRSDFDRTENQRMMLVALKDKVMSAGTLANPIKLTSLFDTLGSHVHTDMTVGEAHRLYNLMENINSSNIKSVSLNDADGKNLLTNYAAPTTPPQSALIPAAGVSDFSQIQLFIKRLTSNSPVIRENANVVLLNASTTYGLAAANETKLAAKGVNVTSVADATQTQAHTTIIDASKGKKPATLTLLKSVYGQSVTQSNPYAQQYPNAAFIVLLGGDQTLD